MGGLKCKMCGSNLDIEDSITVCKCEKCGTSQTVPDIEDDKELKLFERAGRLRFNCDFDKAAGIYNTITDSYPEEAEGYWGLILCKYGIEYADNASGKKVPVCHRISYDSVMDDEDFELVMENSDSESRAIFREEAKITGITPAVFTFSGIFVDCPPTILRPCIFFAYCTGILLSPS